MIRSCSSDLKLYALSRQRCCGHILLPNLGLDDENDDSRLITVISTTSVPSLTSWVLAYDMINRKRDTVLICQNMSFCAQFAPVCSIIPGHRPLKAI
ncbi:hypothetical protein [Candidatus Nitrosocosmicus oleophilus]|uniref:hypothetical protein n=1 Tax=Candidatus Nitrosocosmicus oleophilus TaxID=1353260 RepID=UPI0018CA353D|nr:hypothetical protein [Candidatus Nitrosocosmicus oleophilus]